MTKTRTLVPLALAVAFATNASAACLSDAQAAELAAHYLSRQPAANPEGLSDADGACTRAKLNALLAPRLGKVVGYKAGLTNPAVQKRFNTDKPVWGKLYEGMVLENGATVEAAFGARPLYEADMLVRVKSAAISAINVGARLGVAGAPLAVPVLRAERYALLDALRDMQVRLQDGSGAVLGAGKGSDILEHPLNAVVWLAGALAQEGLAMQPGDLISLGSFSPLLPPKPGLAVTATYHGLPGAAPVRVQFK